MSRLRMAKARVPEKAEQAHGVELLQRLCGRAAVFVSGTRRRRGDYHGTMQTPGIPDVEAFLPARGERASTLLKWECKAVGGRLRPEQAAYQQLCLHAGIAHVVGPFDALIARLTELGYVNANQFSHHRQPKQESH
jgi:hypothetical protein